MNDEYVVYVNHPTNSATIHSITCGKFTKRRRDITRNGFWSIVEHDPFKAIRDAEEYAKKQGKKNIDTCAFCIKIPVVSK